uniref:Uncharacterized protein n=1 Tax=Cyanoderma ruficeps TaxID=181631 RepID=A0A8C3P165_9PASS
MVFRLRDTQRLRGHISHMHTPRKPPRGHSNAGGMQHHRMNSDKHHSDYLQKVGMRHTVTQKETKNSVLLSVWKL